MKGGKMATTLLASSLLHKWSVEQASEHLNELIAEVREADAKGIIAAPASLLDLKASDGVQPVLRQSPTRDVSRALQDLANALKRMSEERVRAFAYDDALRLTLSAYRLLAFATPNPEVDERRQELLAAALRSLADLHVEHVLNRRASLADSVTDISTLLAAVDIKPDNADTDANAYLVSRFDRGYDKICADEELTQSLVRSNIECILTMSLPWRSRDLRQKWRRIGIHIAEPVVQATQVTHREACAAAVDVLPRGVLDRLRAHCQNGAVESIVTDLSAVEGALKERLLVRAEAEPTLRKPASSYRETRRLEFERSVQRLEKHDQKSLGLLTELNRVTHGHSIVMEWLAYAYLLLEPMRVQRNITALQECVAHPHFNKITQWAARWNLACVLRNQPVRSAEALDVLMPVLEEARYYPMEVLYLCLHWALQDERREQLIELLSRCHFGEARLLLALYALRAHLDDEQGGASESNGGQKDVPYFLNQIEAVLWEEDVILPSVGEKLSYDELDDVVNLCKTRGMILAGIQWFCARLSLLRQQGNFKNYQCLGQLYEQAGRNEQAWHEYSQECNITMRNRKAPKAAKRNMMARLLDFACQHPKYAQQAAMLLNTLDMEESERTSMLGKLQIAANGQVPERPGTPAGLGSKGSSREVADHPPALNPGDAQAVIDKYTTSFTGVRDLTALLQRVGDGVELLSAVEVKHPGMDVDALRGVKDFLKRVGSFASARPEDDAKAVLEGLRRDIRAFSPIKDHRDLADLCGACIRGANDLGRKLRDYLPLVLKLPSTLGAQLIGCGVEGRYDTKVFLGVENPYEFPVQLKAVHVSTQTDGIVPDQEGAAGLGTVNGHSAALLEIPLVVTPNLHGAEATITVQLDYDCDVVLRHQRGTDRIPVSNSFERIPVEIRYATSTPVPLDRPDLFQGRSEHLKDLARAFDGGRLQRLYFLNGIRKVGKTTVLRHLGATLGEDVMPMILNMEEIIKSFGDAERLPTISVIREIMAACLREVRAKGGEVHAIGVLAKEDFDGEAPWAIFDSWLEQLSDAIGRKHLLLCIDEMQVLVKRCQEGRVDDGLLTWLRRNVLHQVPSPLLICTGSEPYPQMRAIYEHNVWGNITPYTISFLSMDATSRLAQSPVKNDGVCWLPEACASLWDMTEGHPWITQCICDRIMRTLNKERRRTVAPGDVERATTSLVADDPTAVKLWWNEAQDLISEPMLKLAQLILERQDQPRAGVHQRALYAAAAKAGVGDAGNIVQSMKDLELLSQDVDTGRIFIRGRFLERFLGQGSPPPPEPKVALLLDWENVKRGLLRGHVLREMSEELRPLMAARCRGAELAKILLDEARKQGDPYERWAVAHFDDRDLAGDRDALDALNFRTQTPLVIPGVKKTDRADHVLRERVRDVFENAKDTDLFIIGAGDGDYAYTVQTLINSGKQVVIWAAEGTESGFYRGIIGDNFKLRFLEEFVFRDHQQEKPPLERAGGGMHLTV